MTESHPRENGFVDASGRNWNMFLDYQTILRLRKLDPPVDLLALASENPEAKAFLTRLADDEVFLISVLHDLLEPEIKRRGMTPEEFGAALIGEALDNALDSLIEGIANFSRPQRGAMIRKVWSKLKSSESSLTRQASTMLDSPEIDQAMAEQMTRRMNQVIDDLRNGPRTSSGNSPAKPE